MTKNKISGILFIQTKVFQKTKEKGEKIMKESVVLRRLKEIPNGRYFKMSWKSDVPVFKEFGDAYEVVKVTTSTVRKGIKYTNTKAYKTKLIRQMLEDCGGTCFLTPVDFHKKHPTELPWGHYRKGYENVVIDHTNKAGEFHSYLRLYLSPNKPEIKYYVNGREVSKEELQAKGIVKDSYWNHSKVQDGVFNVKISNILFI